MSKGSLFWGQGSGKLGETVLYRSGGEQRTRAYVAKIKNPKTLAQMQNRILMNNVVSMFRGLKSVLSKSFPQRATKQSGFNAFVSANKNVNAYAIGKSDLEDGGFIPYGLIVAKGDIAISTSLTPEKFYDDVQAKDLYQMVVKGLLPNSVKLEYGETPFDWMSGDALKSSDIYKILKGGSNPLGLPSEFKVTILGGYYAVGTPDGANDAWFPCYRQYVCNATDDDNQVTFGDEEQLKYVQLIPADFTDDRDTQSVSVTSLALRVDAENESDLDQFCAGIIISWTENGSLRVTTSRMNGTASCKEFCKDWAKGGDVYEQVLSEYGYTAADLLSTD